MLIPAIAQTIRRLNPTQPLPGAATDVFSPQKNTDFPWSIIARNRYLPVKLVDPRRTLNGYEFHDFACATSGA